MLRQYELVERVKEYDPDADEAARVARLLVRHGGYAHTVDQSESSRAARW